MNKQQQIKEITEVMVSYGLKRLGEFTETELQVFLDGGKVLEERNYENIISDFATAIYNAGYRKVSDSEAELQELNIKYYNEAKDLRRQLADIEAENERLTERLKQVLLSIDTVKEMNAMCDIDDHRKQAVNEFADELKKKVHNYYPSIDSYCTSKHVILVKDIDELLKEYEQ